MKYIILYKGPATPPDASHAGWPEWFEKVGEQLVDMGSPMLNGFSISDNAHAAPSSDSFNGYGIIEAEDAEQLSALLADHPYLALGEGYTIEAFEIPKK